MAPLVQNWLIDIFMDLIVDFYQHASNIKTINYQGTILVYI